MGRDTDHNYFFSSICLSLWMSEDVSILLPLFLLLMVGLSSSYVAAAAGLPPAPYDYMDYLSYPILS